MYFSQNKSKLQQNERKESDKLQEAEKPSTSKGLPNEVKESDTSVPGCKGKSSLPSRSEGPRPQGIGLRFINAFLTLAPKLKFSTLIF